MKGFRERETGEARAASHFKPEQKVEEEDEAFITMKYTAEYLLPLLVFINLQSRNVLNMHEN